MRMRYCGLLLVLSYSLIGCSSVTTANHQLPDPTPLFIDNAFNYQSQPVETEEDIFALPDDVVRDMEQMVRPLPGAKEKTDTLLNYIFFLKGKRLNYDNAATLTARETLRMQQANCLSLTVLSYSLAKAADLTVAFQDVQIPEYWTQIRGASLLNGHVNLKVKELQSPSTYGSTWFKNPGYVIDFDLETNKSHFPVRTISQQEIVSMFYANKSAQAMLEQNFNLAYAYLRQALTLYSVASDALNNLAILYRQTGYLEEAEAVYLHGISLHPKSINMKANLAVLYRFRGMEEKAQWYERQVEDLRLANPYYHVMLGHEAMRDSQISKAEQSFQHALALEPTLTEAMAGLATLYFQQGRLEQSEKYLKLAGRHAQSLRDKERFNAKLDALMTLQAKL
ncbi:tetratricopeptide repeat protein [Rheinheimera marina]|uniref:Tetratricopeptide repeat protein n=1 Tax=Rheinheimera marina TaxID=1774958 RepID=A0ABV9JNA7_9GAMM